MPLVDVAGLPTYYEVRGEGDAVVLLHGGPRELDLLALLQQDG